MAIDEAIQKKSVVYVLTVSGLIGLCLGISNASWQTMVAPSQIIAGVIQYPVDNAVFLCLSKVYTIFTRISALLLYLTDSEKIVSIVISGFLGVVSFQALSLLTFAVNRDAHIAILSVVFIYFMGFFGRGVIYPIFLLKYGFTHGMLGLSACVLVLALIIAKAYRSGLFCLGLLPAVHPTLGAYLWGIIMLSALFQLDFSLKILRRYYPYFLAGFLVSVLHFALLLYWMPKAPAIEPELKRQIFENMVKYWDHHKRKFYWNYKTQSFTLIKYGVIYCVFSIIMSVLYLRSFKNNSSLTLLFRIILISGVLSLLMGGISHLPPEYVPDKLIIIVPGRFINFNNIIFMAVLMGLITKEQNRTFNLNLILFVLLLVISIAFRYSPFFVLLHFILVTSWLLFFLARSHPSMIQPSGYGPQRDQTARRLPKIILSRTRLPDGKLTIFYRGLFLVMLVFFLSVQSKNEYFINNYIFHRSDFKDRHSDEIYATIAQRKGLMITTAEFDFSISMRTRRPLLIDVGWLDVLLYAPGASKIWNNILKKIYGVDLRSPPPLPYRHLGIVASGLYKNLWEKRSGSEWQRIGKEFGVTDILTKADWHLKLPVIVRDNDKILYEIPN